MVLHGRGGQRRHEVLDERHGTTNAKAGHGLVEVVGAVHEFHPDDLDECRVSQP